MMMNLDFITDEITISDAIKKYHEINKEDRLGLIIPDDCIRLFDKVSESIRFKDVKIIRYYNQVTSKEVIDDALIQAKSVDNWIYELIKELKEMKRND